MADSKITHDFTYFGDILGVSSYYSVSSNEGINKLETFYSIVDEVLKPILGRNKKVNIFIFSDSIFISGRHIEEALTYLGSLYCHLICNNILLRGAMVGGKLDFDPRIRLEDLRKRIPKGDALFRAVELEKKVKGVRLLIEKPLAQSILPEEWYTDAGYFNTIRQYDYGTYDIRRKIKLSTEWNTYEYIWPLIERAYTPERMKYSKPSYFLYEELKFLQDYAPPNAKSHYSETKKFIKKWKPLIDTGW